MKVPSVPGDARPVTVLLSLSPPNGTTRYVDQVVEGAPPEVTFLFFSWRRALLGGYDVFHVHWPEFLIRDPRPAKAFLKRRALDALLLLQRMRRVGIVRTLHNLNPHEAGHGAETRALEKFDRRTNLFIRLNPTTPRPGRAETVTILHGHYRDRFEALPHPEAIPGRVLHFGLIRPYKGVETLLDVFRSTDRPDLELRLVGRPSGGLREVIEREQERDPRVSSTLRFVPDEEMVDEVCRAELVVLPYREMHNSGAILVALSLGRPVLVPNAPPNAALAEEVGPGWVHLYTGELTPAVFERTLNSVRARGPAPAPSLSGREWGTLGLQTYDVYLRAAELAGHSGARGAKGETAPQPLGQRERT
jgi:beta-1,4-mannosyltransferase